MSFLTRAAKAYALYHLFRPIPALVTLRVTGRCNQSCEYCDFKGTEHKEMNTKQLIKAVADIADAGVAVLNVSGGEPLLRNDLEDIGKEALSHGMAAVLNTNGTLITKKRARGLLESFSIVKISIDGLEDSHDSLRGKGAFKAAESGLKALLAVKGRKGKVMLHFVANGRNAADIVPFMERFKDKADGITIMPVMHERSVYSSKEFLEAWKRVKNDLHQSADIIRRPFFRIGKEHCDALALHCSILPDGTVTPCSRLLGPSIGNVNEKDFSRIWVLRPMRLKEVDSCPGCYSRCTTEISMLMRKSPLNMLAAVPGLLRRTRF